MEIFLFLTHNILPFLFVLTIVVFVHEFGHFWVARRCGVKVDIFSIGFGKELFGFNDKHGTRWKFCLIPLGGYIKMFGDKNSASYNDQSFIEGLTSFEKEQTFQCKSLLQKSAIVVAGPASNYLFSALIFALFFFIHGYPQSTNIITNVMENSPASKSGIKIGDEVNEINGKTIKDFNDIRDIMALNLGETIKVKINDKEEKNVTPEKLIEKDVLGNTINSYKIGIGSSEIIFKKQNILSSIILAIKECYKLTTSSLTALGQIVSGKRSTNELGGPIKIAQYSSKTAEAGIVALFGFVAILSLNLGLMNLLPIPVLDGGHLLLFLIEGVAGKRIATKIQNYGFQLGLFLLIMLTIFVTFQDLTNLLLKK